MPLLFYLSMSIARLNGLFESGSADVLITAAFAAAMALVIFAMCLEKVACWILQIVFGITHIRYLL
jgi:hypothetical protein